jgi:1,4-dihydroxy-2-naphthoyl-CoA hydrolase
MSIFKSPFTVDQLNKMCANNMLEHVGMVFTNVGEDFIEAKMPVDHRTHQPFGILHGGASVVLAESLGSIAAAMCVDMQKQICVGLDINANHIKSVRDGFVYGKVEPIHIGKTTHVWEIKIVNEKTELVCISRITMAVLDKK